MGTHLTALGCQALLLLGMGSAGLCAQAPSTAELNRQAAERFVAAQYEQAVTLLRQSLALNPKQARPVKLLGICLQLLSRIEEAKHAFRNAIEIDRNDADAWYLLGRLYYVENFFSQAREALETARRLDERDVRVRECLALTLEAAGDIPGAIEEFHAAIAWNSRKQKPAATPHLSYGVLLHKLDRLDESARQLQTAIEIHPKDWEAYFELAKLFYTRGDLDSAARQLNLALSQGTANPAQASRVRRLLSQVYSRMGREEEARAILAAAEGP
jgi:Flp pilus assembly protein TadD